jgi:hypothetical protein
MVYSIYDSTEVAIQKMIDASQRILKVNTPGDLVGGMNPAVKKHYELQIKTLQNERNRQDTLQLICRSAGPRGCVLISVL